MYSAARCVSSVDVMRIFRIHYKYGSLADLVWQDYELWNQVMFWLIL